MTSGSTFKRSIAAKNRRRVVRFSLTTLMLGLCALAAALMAGNSSAVRPNLSKDATGVTCSNARLVAGAFASAVQDASDSPPDFQSVKGFGFTAPTVPSDIASLRETLQARLNQVYAKARSAAQGTCTDNPKASIIDADGTSKVLPVVDGDQPMAPVSGSQANQDPRTVPVTFGTDSNTTRTNTWSELDQPYGDEAWYTKCADDNLAMSWKRDVPTYVRTESGHDNRFIVAINVSDSLTDDQIRAEAARDGNPHTDQLKVVRYDSIINTRHLSQNRCDEFIHTRSQIRVSLGKVIFDAKGNFKELKTDEGIFVDCHNLWRLPRSKPVPTPTPSTPGVTPPGTTPPGTTPGTTPPHTSPPKTTPPTTKPPKCVPPAHENNNGKCIVPKDPNDGAGHNGNVPEPVKGTNPPVTSKPEPRPSNPPETYKPPAPPKDDPEPAPKPTKTRTQPPPPKETAAPDPTDPATGCVPPPGMTEC